MNEHRNWVTFPVLNFIVILLSDDCFDIGRSGFQYIAYPVDHFFRYPDNGLGRSHSSDELLVGQHQGGVVPYSDPGTFHYHAPEHFVLSFRNMAHGVELPWRVGHGHQPDIGT